MQDKKITKKDLRKHIIKYYNYFQGRFWGFIHLTHYKGNKKEFTKFVEGMFKFQDGNYIGYNWIEGNDKMQEFIKQTIK